jgi:transposase
VEAGLAGIEILGVERRRRWSDAMKLSILAEVNTNGWTLSDVARRHDLTRQHLYQWRRELRLKGLWPDGASEAFVAVELLPAPDDARPPIICDGAAPEITITLRNGRQLRCRETIADPALAQLLRMLEAS